MKKIVRILMFVLCFLLLISAANCNSRCNSDEEPQIPEHPKKVVVTLSETELSLEVYEETILTATVRNSKEAVIWSSDRTDVVAVSGGKVSALKEGSTVIRATVGDVSAVCTVTIVDNGAKPFIDVMDGLTALTKAVGDQFSLPVRMMFLGKEVACQLEYTSSDNEVVSVEEGRLSARSTGIVQITISGEYLGNKVGKSIMVTVLEV